MCAFAHSHVKTSMVRRPIRRTLTSTGAVVAALALFGRCLDWTVTALTQPKRPASSYMLWLKDNRPRIVEELGVNTVGPVGKKAGEEWNALSAKEKKKYESKAEDLKVDYQKAMDAFLAEGGVKETRRKAGAKAKKVKDPAAPKRPKNAYMLWLQDNRESIKKSLPDDHKPTEVMVKAGEDWKVLKATAKKKYEKQAAEAKQEYEKLMEEYKQAA